MTRCQIANEWVKQLYTQVPAGRKVGWHSAVKVDAAKRRDTAIYSDGPTDYSHLHSEAQQPEYTGMYSGMTKVRSLEVAYTIRPARPLTLTS